jgi:enterochelin esterase family protein
MRYTIAELTGDENGDQDAPGRPDPFNPRGFPDDTMDRTVAGDRSGNGEPASVAELPDARPLTWVRRRPDVPRGMVVEHVHVSDVLGSSRRVWVHLPAGYESTDQAYPVMVLHDGWEWAALTPVAPILDNLIAEGCIPGLITVMHESPDREELACEEPFVDFLAAELLPWARGLYRITDDPARTIVAGQSYGGLNAAFCALQRPDVFGNVLSQSGSFWFRAGTEFDVEYGWLVSRYVSSPTLPVRFYLDVGLLEAYMVPVNRHMRDVLLAKGYPVAYQEFNGDHSWLCWRDTISDGLVRLTSQW